MCRIVGYYDFKNKYSSKEILLEMRDTMTYGGPDAEGIYINKNIGLAHRRLSIIDLSSSGNQPMEIGEWVITFNGEIYNYQEIKNELITCGYNFITKSDTEVIIRAYEKWGTSSFDKFRGMFAFAIYNKISKKLFIAYAIILFTAINLTACEKSEADEPMLPSPSSTTITSQVSTSASLTLLKSAVVKAGLASTLDGAGPYTVFAPTDDAFIASGITSSVINSLSADKLKSILLYHVLASKILSTGVPAGPNAKVVTASGDSFFVTNNLNGVFVNGLKVTTADLPASNGVIHTLGKVLMPPAGNIVDVAAADTTFSFLVAAVLRASKGSTNVAAVLSGNTPLTVFAPTNNAFRAAGFATIDAINAVDPNTLTTILTYHVVAGRVFSSDLVNAAQPSTVNGGKVIVSLSSNSAAIKGNSNPSASNIAVTNIMASNGVIHVIDQVLLP